MTNFYDKKENQLGWRIEPWNFELTSEQLTDSVRKVLLTKGDPNLLHINNRTIHLFLSTFSK